MDGILNIYKEPGFTSHDVVAKLRGIIGQKKIGHTGTLDPDAAGVLPVCLGKSTKVCDLLTDKDKVYETTLLLGIQTDTQDTSGTVQKECETKSLTEERVREAVLEFCGEYAQIPPMYSAIKVGGKKLYELARQGIEVERKKRRVIIYSIEIMKIELPRVEMKVHCSKGTYIRTLCHDVGEKLFTGGCMEKLKRVQSGSFSIDESLKLEEVEKKKAEGTLDKVLIPTWKVFEDYPSVVIAEQFQAKVYNGGSFKQNDIMDKPENSSHAEHVKVFDEENHFIGIYRYEREKNYYKPVKMFLEGI